TIQVQHDPCSEHKYSQPHDSCGQIGALPEPKTYKSAEDAGPGDFQPRAATTIGATPARNGQPAFPGVSIVKPKELGGITAYDLNTGDRKWWVPNGNLWREQTTSDPLFAGVTL